MRRRWWILPLIAIVLLAIPAFIKARKTDQQVLLVVDSFCQALRTGDSESAVELLSPELVDSARDRVTLHEGVWRASPALRYQVQRLKVRGDDAVADLWMFDGPQRIRPSLKLRRNSAGAWRIARIDGVPKPDPEEERQTALKQEQEERSERLVMELEQAIGKLPGVLVNRPEPATDSSR